MDKIRKFAFISLIANITYSVYYLLYGITAKSWWYFTLGSYYVILSIVRYVVLRTKKNGTFITKFAGRMLMALSLPIASTVILSFMKDRGQRMHMIVMLAIATYAFTKITLATIKLIRSHHSRSVRIVALRNISFADGFVSIFALQRSMLVSFEGMTEADILLMNVITGWTVCVIVFLLGVNLVINKRAHREG